MDDPKVDPKDTGVMPGTGTGSGGETPPTPPAPSGGSTGPAAGATPATGVMPAAGKDPVAPASADGDTTNLQKALAAERKRADTAEKELKKIGDAQLSETERLQKENAELKAAGVKQAEAEKASRVRVAAVSVAARLGFADPEDATRYIDQAEIVFDDAGVPTNIATLAQAVLKAKPYLASASARPSGSQDFGSGAPQITQADLAKMSPEQIANNWDAIVKGTGGKLT